MSVQSSKARLLGLIARAEFSGQWLYCKHDGSWFTPAELKISVERGLFVYGPRYWELSAPTHLLSRTVDCHGGHSATHLKFGGAA